MKDNGLSSPFQMTRVDRNGLKRITPKKQKRNKTISYYRLMFHHSSIIIDRIYQGRIASPWSLKNYLNEQEKHLIFQHLS